MCEPHPFYYAILFCVVPLYCLLVPFLNCVTITPRKNPSKHLFLFRMILNLNFISLYIS